MKEEIELLKAKVRALELEIELLKANQHIQYIPYPNYPYMPYPASPLTPFWYGAEPQQDFYKVTC